MTTTIAILAAGLGTRMRSKRAKVLHRAGGLPLVEHVVRAAGVIAAPDRTVVVTGHQAELVEAALSGRGLGFVRQDGQKGTGHALASCRELLSGQDGMLMVLYGDTPLLTAATLVRLRDLQASSGAAATMITTTLEDPTGYGRVVIDPNGNATEIVEHKNCTADQLKIKVINSGIYCFRSDLLWQHLATVQPNPASGEYYLTDMVDILNRLGHRVGVMHIDDPNELLGINTRVELAEADAVLRGRKRRELMLAGVTIEQPETVAIDIDVEVGQDTIIEPFVRLLGATRIGEDCTIGAGAILDSMVIASGVTIYPYCNLTQSRVATGAKVGPFARIRPNTQVDEGAEVGNFAELKNTRLGAGAKSHHVSYLGDAEIGAKTNIGAGTIICNYDGARKHRTTIGAGVFVGSNSTLVAPVELADGSYVGAGSVITDAVPSDALALGRARQITKPDWVKKRTQKTDARK